jgi:predicted Zn-ribbon and HTH transcriptional regulator
MQFAFGSFEMPDEMKEHLDRMEMASDEFQHALERIWGGLSTDDLRLVARFFMTMAHDDEANLHAGILAGRLIQMRADRTKTCALDGKDHDAELAEMSGQPPTADVVDENVLMKQYRLNRMDDGKLVCRDCGYGYPSLEDRMVRAPDDCPGCKNKSKWG